MGEHSVSIVGEQLTLPEELYEALERPRALDLRPPDDEGGRFLIPPTVRSRIRRPVYRLSRVGESNAEYISRRRSEPEAEYRIANYHPAYYLMPQVEHDRYWHDIQNYHEHRSLSAQQGDAHRVTSWLVDEVLAPLGDSFLEFGCGAGRNLAALRAAKPPAQLTGVEINEAAAALASAHAEVVLGSLYDIDQWVEPVDVVYTSGVLMHVPHDRVADVVAMAHRVATRAVVHFELHGPAHNFDFHRYPRDYNALYEQLGLRVQLYEVFPPGDFRSAGLGGPFRHALLVSPKLAEAS